MGACLALSVCECTACLACACCQKAMNGMLAGAARLGHVLLIGTIFSLAGILGSKYPQDVNNYHDYTDVNLSDNCNSNYEDTCIYRQLMYRASFSLFLVFCMLAVGSLFSDYLNKSLWPFKFAVATSMFVGFWWGSNDFFAGWAECARAVSFVWLLFQSLLLIDFGHDLHDVLIAKADSAESEEEGSGRPWLVTYMIFSFGFLAAAGTGLAYLFMNYSGCRLGMFFIVVTLIFGVITTILSLLNTINKGFLTPCIMFAYSVFMCWYALLSCPNEECNPTAWNSDNYQWRISIIVLIIVSSVVLLYCVVNGTAILNIFNPEGQGVMQYQMSSGSALTKSLTDKSGGDKGLKTDETKGPEQSGGDSDGSGSGSGTSEETSGTPQERVYFHILMIFFIIYGTMMLTNWGKTDGNVIAAGSHVITNESMWFKIISQWGFIAMYCRILQLAYQDNQV